MEGQALKFKIRVMREASKNAMYCVTETTGRKS